MLSQILKPRWYLLFLLLSNHVVQITTAIMNPVTFWRREQDGFRSRGIQERTRRRCLRRPQRVVRYYVDQGKDTKMWRFACEQAGEQDRTRVDTVGRVSILKQDPCWVLSSYPVMSYFVQLKNVIRPANVAAKWSPGVFLKFHQVFCQVLNWTLSELC